MRHVLVGSLRSHARRYLASALAICLGVAFVAATLVVLTSSRAALADAVAPQYEDASYVVLGAPAEYTPDNARPPAIDRITRVPGVEAADGLATATPRMTVAGRSEHLPIGTVPSDPDLRWQQLRDGRLPRTEDEIVLDARLLEEYGIAVGDTIELSAGNGAERATVVGAVEPAGLSGGPEAFATTAALVNWIGTVHAGEVLIRGSNAVDPAALTAAVREVAPNAEVLTAQQRKDDVIAGLTRNLDVQGAFLIGFAAIAVFVAILVVANTFTVLLAQRVRELALLRCVGAVRRQLFGSLLAEAGVLGFVASAVGVAMGFGLGAVAFALLGGTGIGLAGATVRPDAVAILVPLAVGVVATVVAALLPARRATMVPPLAALRPAAAIRVRSRAGVLRLACAAVLLAGGGALLAVGSRGGEGAEILVGVAGGALSFLGILLLGPVLVPLVIRLLGLLIGLPRRRSGRQAGQLAVANALRNPRRTAVTTSALLVGVTLIMIMTVGAASVRATLLADLDEQYPVDIALSTTGPDTVPEPVRTSVEDLPEVTATATLSALAGDDIVVNGLPVDVLGADPRALGSVLRDDSLADEFDARTALIGPDLAEGMGVEDGDELELGGSGEPLAVDVRVTPALVGGAELVVTDADLARLGSTTSTGALWAQLDDGADVRAVVNEIETTLATVDGVVFGGGAPERAFYEQVLEILLLVAIGLLAIAVLIALVGVGNTLSLSIIERTREHALLRALGLRRGQLRRIIVTEAALLAGAAVLLGVPLGTFYGWVGTSALTGELSEHLTLALPGTQVLIIVVVALGAGLLASVLPARRALGVAPAAALADQ